MLWIVISPPGLFSWFPLVTLLAHLSLTNNPQVFPISLLATHHLRPCTTQLPCWLIVVFILFGLVSSASSRPSPWHIFVVFSPPDPHAHQSFTSEGGSVLLSSQLVSIPPVLDFVVDLFPRSLCSRVGFYVC